MGVTLLFKLNAGDDEVVVHAVTPAIMQINTRINAAYNIFLLGGTDDFVMELELGSALAAHSHYS